jgi:hypothetical protein
MTDFVVHPHGERWAIREAGAESPIKEFGTREAAELAARDLAGDGRVEVREDDPSGLREDPRSGEAPPDDEPSTAPVDEPATGRVDATERTRSLQTGL